jgi:hypothetical protein
MTEATVDLLTMAGGATLGKTFNVVSQVLGIFTHMAKAQVERRSALLSLAEKSRERAEKTNGGVMIRRGIYLLISVAFISIIVAGFMQIPVVIENVVTKGAFFWKKEVNEYVTVTGVPFLDANRRAMFALLTFYLGAKA